jgi:C-terminal processing protease CtpA/Prc
MSAGLIIQEINGVATAGKSLAECIELSPGGVGAKVRMELVTLKGKQTNTVEVTKQKFLVSSK